VNGDEHNVVSAEIDGGPKILVEVRTPMDTEQDVGIGDVFSFDGLTDSIEAIADKMAAALENARPDKATVEFGLDVGVESSGLVALIAKGGGNATLKVSLEWNRPRPAPK
jgi:hypothetical protein